MNLSNNEQYIRPDIKNTFIWSDETKIEVLGHNQPLILNLEKRHNTQCIKYYPTIKSWQWAYHFKWLPFMQLGLENSLGLMGEIDVQKYLLPSANYPRRVK